MRAMILAAGRGERMRELTLQTPKPLLEVGGRPLIEYAVYSLKRAGIHEIVINVSWLGSQIKDALGNGQRYGVDIFYSEEEQRLETGGGIFQALPLLGGKPFIVVSSDIISSFPLETLPKEPTGLAHLILVDNPPFHPEGDFGLHEGRVDLEISPKKTFANIGIYRPEIFADCTPGYFPWKQVMFPVIRRGLVTGELFEGRWHNIGTPDDLQRAREDSNLRPLASETNTLSN